MNFPKEKVSLGGNAKIVVKQISLLGDVKITVTNNLGEKEKIEILEDHIPYLIDVLQKLQKKFNYC